jgi:hypothetical protein
MSWASGQWIRGRAIWFIAIMLPMTLFSYGIGELSFGAYSPGQRLTVGGFPALTMIFALFFLGVACIFLSDIEHRASVALWWLLFMAISFIFIHYVLFYPISMFSFGLGEALSREQPQRLIIQSIALCVWVVPVALAITICQKLLVRCIGGSALLWFPLHFATGAIGFALALSASWIRFNYQPMMGVFLAAPGVPYALFVPFLLKMAPSSSKRLLVGLLSVLVFCWTAVYTIWRSDERPPSNAALWPILAATEHMSFSERQALNEAMRRQRGGEPMRIGQVWYRFPENAVRSKAIRRSDAYPAYYGINIYVDLSGLVNDWPADRDAALVGVGIRPAAIIQEPSCPGESSVTKRLRERESKWPSCTAALVHRGNPVWFRYPMRAHDYLPQMKANLERLLDQYVIDVDASQN